MNRDFQYRSNKHPCFITSSLYSLFLTFHINHMFLFLTLVIDYIIKNHTEMGIFTQNNLEHKWVKEMYGSVGFTQKCFELKWVKGKIKHLSPFVAKTLSPSISGKFKQKFFFMTPMRNLPPLNAEPI